MRDDEIEISLPVARAPVAGHPDSAFPLFLEQHVIPALRTARLGLLADLHAEALADAFQILAEFLHLYSFLRVAQPLELEVHRRLRLTVLWGKRRQKANAVRQRPDRPCKNGHMW